MLSTMFSDQHWYRAQLAHHFHHDQKFSVPQMHGIPILNLDTLDTVL